MARDCDANLLGSYAPFSSAHSEAAAAMEMEKSLSLSVCFELGKALRYSDAERFLSIYDSLLQDGSVEQDLQLIDVKEWSRQISELTQDDFVLLHTATLSPSNNTCDVSIATDEPVAIQLFGLIEKLRMMESATSDSGAVSDYSEATDCKSHSSTSLSLEAEEGDRSGSDILGRDNSAGEGDGLFVEGQDKSMKTLAEADGVCSEVEGLRLENERSVEPDNDMVGERTGAEQESTSQLDVELAGSKAEESEKEKGEWSTQKEAKVEKDTIVCRHYSVCERGLDGRNSSSDTSPHHHVEMADSIAKRSKRELLEQPKVAKSEKADIPDGIQSFGIRRKTKRYNGPNWRRNCGYYGNGNYGNRRNNYSYYGNGNERSRRLQSTFSSSSAKPHSQSSFNHEEIVKFLWKRWRNVEKEMSS